MDKFSLAKTLKQKILPAITFDEVKHVLPVAEALLNAGLKVFEIPFRTEIAEKAIALVRKTFPEMNVGAGTLLTTVQLKKAIDTGATFGLSPGFNQTVCNEAKRLGFAFIPGVMTPSEIEQAYEMGFSIQKLFPAEQIGGPSFLKAMMGPYDQLDINFIPMGGVNIENVKAYAELKNVIAIGGSWMVTKELMTSKNYKAIEQNIVAVLQLAN